MMWREKRYVVFYMTPRILFIVPLPPPVYGSTMVCQQIKDSALINSTFHCDYVNLSTSRQMDEIGKRSAVKLWRMISAFIKTFWLLLIHRYDICYIAIACRGSGFLKDAPFVLLCKLFRRKMVIHHHNKGMANDVDRMPFKWLMPMVYKNAKVILLSWYLYFDIEKIVPKENVMICPNGIVADNLEHIAVGKSENRVPHLLFLSNLMKSKGVYVLLDACKILKDKGLEFVCDFVGGETAEIDSDMFNTEVNRRGLGTHVIYNGRKYSAEKARFFADSDIFIHPTYNDCFPLVLLEAMQYQLPIVTTNEGGIPDVVQDGVNGIICERQNAESLAAAIERLLINPALRRQMGEAGYEIFRQKFTLEKFEHRMCECLDASCN